MSNYASFMKNKFNKGKLILLGRVFGVLSLLSTPCMASDKSTADELKFIIGQDIYPLSCTSMSYPVPKSGLTLAIKPQSGALAFIEITDINYKNNLKATVISSGYVEETHNNFLIGSISTRTAGGSFTAKTENYSDGNTIAAFYFDEKHENQLRIASQVDTNVRLRIAYVKPSSEFSEKLSYAVQLSLNNNILARRSSHIQKIVKQIRMNQSVPKDISMEPPTPDPPVNMNLLCPPSRTN